MSSYLEESYESQFSGKEYGQATIENQATESMNSKGEKINPYFDLQKVPIYV